MHIITRSVIAAAALAAIGAAVPAVALADTTSTIIDTQTTLDTDLIGVGGSLEQGAFLDTMATENAVDQLLGVSSTASETSVLSDWTSLFPDATLPTGDTLPAVGATGFDASLITIADGEFANAGTSTFTDVTGLLPSLGTDITGVLPSLGTDLTTLLPDLLSGLGL